MSDSPARPDPYPPGALPIGSRLGEFEIRGVLGVGGFGIVYLAFDHLLEREVALKEYMPATLAGRTATMHISLLSESNADTFALGLRSFVNEARLLARFDHPSLVKVHRFWEANGTAYMAMALYKGRTVRDVRLEMRQTPGEAWVRRLLEPLLGAIERLHGEDVYHRDIAPDNILLEADGRPVLLDFGAARRVISDKSQNLTAILKPSYAPIEQYADTPGMKQGPWTDIYALGATVHFLLLGRPPPPAPARAIQDQMVPLAQLEGQGCSPGFLALLDWMLAPLPEDRPQTVAEVRDVLAGRAAPPVRGAGVPDIDLDSTLPLPQTMAPRPSDPSTQVVPRAPMPPARDVADDATVILPRTGMPPMRTAMPPVPPPTAPAPYDPAHPPTMVVPRTAQARPTSFDEDATVVTPRGVPGSMPTGMPPAAPPVPPIPPTMAYRPPAAGGGSAATPTPASLPPRPAPPAGQPARRGVHWAIPVVAGVVVVGALGAWLWPRSASQVASYADPASSAASSASMAATPTMSPAPTSLPAPTSEAAASATPLVSTPAVVETAPAPAPAPVVAPPPSTRATTPSRPPPTRQPAPKPEPPVRQAERPPVVTPSPPPTPTPAPVKPEPATAAVPTPPPAPVVLSPSERCRNQLPLVRLVCIDIECGKAELAAHPECVKLRADQARVRERVPGN